VESAQFQQIDWRDSGLGPKGKPPQAPVHHHAANDCDNATETDAARSTSSSHPCASLARSAAEFMEASVAFHELVVVAVVVVVAVAYAVFGVVVVAVFDPVVVGVLVAVVVLVTVPEVVDVVLAVVVEVGVVVVVVVEVAVVDVVVEVVVAVVVAVLAEVDGVEVLLVEVVVVVVVVVVASFVLVVAVAVVVLGLGWQEQKRCVVACVASHVVTSEPGMQKFCSKPGKSAYCWLGANFGQVTPR